MAGERTSAKVSSGHGNQVSGEHRQQTEQNRIILKRQSEFSLDEMDRHPRDSAARALPPGELIKKTGNGNRKIVGEEKVTSPAHCYC